MTFRKQQIIAYITDNLAFSSKNIALENAIGLFDGNRAAQDFFVGLFSLIFGYSNLQELDKLNGVVNYPAIDLGDKSEKIAFQITTNSNSEKIKDTIKRFIDYKLYESYDKLIIFIIGEKKSYTTAFETNNLFSFNRDEDIWDDNYLIKEVDKLDLPTLEKIQKFLEENLVEFKFPDRLYDTDIKECIKILKRDIADLLDNNREESVLNRSIPDRSEDFIKKKNEINNISWDFFKGKIQGHLQYGETIDRFLRNPINNELQKDYLEVTDAIQNFYQNNQNDFSSFEDVFRNIFGKLKTYDDGINGNKIKIVLHNMYFNCDIGTNPPSHD